MFLLDGVSFPLIEKLFTLHTLVIISCRSNRIHKSTTKYLLIKKEYL